MTCTWSLLFLPVALFTEVCLVVIGTIRLWIGRPVFDLKTGGRDLKSQFTEWACITGATDGIGRDLALQLASRDLGAHLLLIGRSREKLQKVIAEIGAIKGFVGQTQMLVHDFAEGSATEQSAALQAGIKDKTISILINNVGQSYPHPFFWGDMPVHLFERLLNVNLMSTMLMTQVVLERMRAAASRKVIVCLGSLSVTAGEPMHSAYVSTKQGIRSFCRSLAAEVPEVRVHCVEPGWVETKMTARYQGAVKGMVTSPDCARYILNAMERGGTLSPRFYSPHPLHALQQWVIHLVPLHIWLNLRLAMRKRSTPEIAS